MHFLAYSGSNVKVGGYYLSRAPKCFDTLKQPDFKLHILSHLFSLHRHAMEFVDIGLPTS